MLTEFAISFRSYVDNGRFCELHVSREALLVDERGDLLSQGVQVGL